MNATQGLDMTKSIRATKYESTRDLDIKEIAKLVRKDLKEAFPTYRFNVTIERYAGGQSLHIQINNTGLEYKVSNESIHQLEMAVRDIAYQYDRPQDNDDFMSDYSSHKFFCNDVRIRS